jgi:hypothetical protein
LDAQLLAGNHDFATYRLQEWRAKRFVTLKSDDPAGGDMLILHGDLFSWIERLVPEEVRAAAVRFAKWHATGEHDLYNDADTVEEANQEIDDGDSPIGAVDPTLANPNGGDGAEVHNVIFGDRGDPDEPNKKFYQPAKELVEAFREHDYNITTIVIGHTHYGRILASDDGDFALVDAGAWIGRCRIEVDQVDPILNAQIGVVVGNDLRVYQLGWRPA